MRIDGGAWQATTLEAQGALLLAIQGESWLRTRRATKRACPDLEECAAQCASKQAQLHAVHCEVALLRERIQWARMQTAHMRRSHDKQQQQSVEYREWETAERELRDTQTSLEQARHERAELEQWLRADEAAAHVQRMQERDVADATEQKRANLRALQAQLTVTLAADHAGQVAQLKEEEARLMPQVTRLNAERTQRACQLLEASVAHARAQVRK